VDLLASAKGKFFDVGDKMKEKGEEALKTAGETYEEVLGLKKPTSYTSSDKMLMRFIACLQNC